MHVDAKVTSKNQITLPQAVRRRLGLGPGEKVRFEIADDGRITVARKMSSIEDLRGIVPYDGPPLSDAEIQEAIRAARDARADHHLKVLADSAGPARPESDPSK